MRGESTEDAGSKPPQRRCMKLWVSAAEVTPRKKGARLGSCKSEQAVRAMIGRGHCKWEIDSGPRWLHRWGPSWAGVGLRT